jgi:hypothetical protein
VGSPVCEWVVPWLCCAARPAARDRRQLALQTSHNLYVNATINLCTVKAHRCSSQQRRLIKRFPPTPGHTGGSMVTYQADSPSRMCDGSLDEAARMVDKLDVPFRH